MDAELAELHLVLFSPGFALPSDKARLLVEVNEVARGHFDGDPVLLPIPDEAPPEIPRIILLSKSRTEVLEITKTYAALKLLLTPTTDLPLKPDFALEFLPRLCGFLENRLGAGIVRVGFVTVWLSDSSPLPPAAYLQRHYLQPHLPERNPQSIEIHALEKLEIANYQCNLWTRIRSVEWIRLAGTTPAVSITFDANTLPELVYKLSAEELGGFVSVSHSLMRSRLAEHLHLAEVTS